MVNIACAHEPCQNPPESLGKTQLGWGSPRALAPSSWIHCTPERLGEGWQRFCRSLLLAAAEQRGGERGEHAWPPWESPEVTAWLLLGPAGRHKPGPGEGEDVATTEEQHVSLGCGTESHGFNLLACTQVPRLSWHGRLWACMSP